MNHMTRTGLCCFLVLGYVSASTLLSAPEEPQNSYGFVVTNDPACHFERFDSFEVGNNERLVIMPIDKAIGISNFLLKVHVVENQQIIFWEGEPPEGIESVLWMRQGFGVGLTRDGQLDVHHHDNLGVVPAYHRVAEREHLERRGCLAATTLDKTLPGVSQRLEVDLSNLERTVRILAGAEPYNGEVIEERGSDNGRERARTVLKNLWQEVGVEPQEQCFGWLRKGCNLIVNIPGESSETFVVGAHLDSVNNPGADDDATGIAALVEVARIFSHHKLKRTLRLIAFDLEEKGLLGSKAYVGELSTAEREQIIGNLTMEMLGYDSNQDGVFHIIDCRRPQNRSLVEQGVDAAKQFPELAEPRIHCTNRSDHAPFWDIGIPAIVISQAFFAGDANPCYHRSCDRFETIHGDYFRQLASLAATIVAGVVL